MERAILSDLAGVTDLAAFVLEASIRRTQPQRWEMMRGTMAETWMQEAKAGVFLRQLQRRFGTLVRERVTGATMEKLDA